MSLPALAKRLASFEASGIRKVFDLAATLKNPVNLSIGQPDFDVPEALKEAAIDAIRRGFNRYTVTQGIPELHRAIREHLKRTRGFSPEGVLVTSGVSGGLLLAFLTLLDPGDEVVAFDPYFVMYKHLPRLLGAVPVFVDTYPDFRVRRERLEAAITPRTKLVLAASPANPTGAVIPESDLRMICEVARQRGIRVLSDEIYDAFSYDGPHVSPASFDPAILLLGGFSKSAAMTGWRVGYAAGEASVIAEMTKLQQYTFVCAPAPFQRAAVAALDGLADGRIPSFLDAYRRKRDLVVEGLRGALDLTPPGGAFYAFPRAPWGSGSSFVEAAIRENLLVIPGSVFSERDTHLRISFAAPDETIRKGCGILRRLAERGATA